MKVNYQIITFSIKKCTIIPFDRCKRIIVYFGVASKSATKS